MLAIITINIDPVFFHLGPVAVHWYGIMYAVAFTAGFYFGVLPYLLPRGVDKPYLERLLFTTIIFALLGARLYYVIQQPDLSYYLHNPIQIIAVWQGGMAFFGAIIAGAATCAWRAHRDHKSFWLLFDSAALFGVIGQPIGRIGNVINGDILGSPSSLPWATAYTNPHAVLQSCCRLGVGYQPAAIYEALGTVLIGVVLFALVKKHVRPGVICITYVTGYAISQFLIFFLRDSEPAIGLGLKQAQWTGLFMLIVVVPLMILLWRRSAPNEQSALQTTEFVQN
jgi:phosphatidylglycerol---prolipoprotein diacylglyceryl transferase